MVFCVDEKTAILRVDPASLDLDKCGLTTDGRGRLTVDAKTAAEVAARSGARLLAARPEVGVADDRSVGQRDLVVPADLVLWDLAVQHVVAQVIEREEDARRGDEQRGEERGPSPTASGRADP